MPRLRRRSKPALIRPTDPDSSLTASHLARLGMQQQAGPQAYERAEGTPFKQDPQSVSKTPAELQTTRPRHSKDSPSKPQYTRRASKESHGSKGSRTFPSQHQAGATSDAINLRDSSGSDDPEEVARVQAAARKARKLRRQQSGGGSVTSAGSRGSVGSVGRRAAQPSAPGYSAIVGRADVGDSQDVNLNDEASNTSVSATSAEGVFDLKAERERLVEFFNAHGYMPAPRQPAEQARRRLRAIRRLDIDNPDDIHRETLDRFTRLAASIFKCSMSAVTIVGKDCIMFPSEIGLGVRRHEIDLSLCCHTILSPGSKGECLVVPNVGTDWRFENNPMVNGTMGNIQFYAGSPLRVGTGEMQTVIGTLCVLDDKPREFGSHGKAVLKDLAECVVSEVSIFPWTAADASSNYCIISKPPSIVRNCIKVSAVVVGGAKYVQYPSISCAVPSKSDRRVDLAKEYLES